MIAIVILGISLALVGQLWHTASMREKEKELLFVGDQFRKAIFAFHEKNSAAGDGFPKTLDELLADPHQPELHRYLRKVYRDPVSGSDEWGIVRSPGGGIAGVYSLAPGEPFKLMGFPKNDEEFAGSRRYADWRFAVAIPPPPLAIAPSPPPAPSPAPGSPGGPPSPVPIAILPPAPVDPNHPDCGAVAARDAALCAAQAKRWGEARACYLSADARLHACSSGELPLPALIVRNR